MIEFVFVCSRLLVLKIHPLLAILFRVKVVICLSISRLGREKDSGVHTISFICLGVYTLTGRIVKITSLLQIQCFIKDYADEVKSKVDFSLS